MRGKIFGLVVSLGIVGLLVGCGPKEHEHEAGMEMEQPTQTAEEKVKCAYDGMEMFKSAMEATMEYKGQTLYFCTKEEMEKFHQDPDAYLSGEKKGEMGR